MINLIGYAAALLTTLAFVPQAWLTWKTKSAQGVSVGMYTIFVTGVGLWLVYGLMLGAWQLILANGVNLVLAVFILAMKLRFG
jgi:MtN3 and saliva related transmembrane protein